MSRHWTIDQQPPKWQQIDSTRRWTTGLERIGVMLHCYASRLVLTTNNERYIFFQFTRKMHTKKYYQNPSTPSNRNPARTYACRFQTEGILIVPNWETATSPDGCGSRCIYAPLCSSNPVKPAVIVVTSLEYFIEFPPALALTLLKYFLWLEIHHNPCICYVVSFLCYTWLLSPHVLLQICSSCFWCWPYCLLVTISLPCCQILFPIIPENWIWIIHKLFNVVLFFHLYYMFALNLIFMFQTFTV